MTPESGSERRPPRERFSGTEHVFDLLGIATELRYEDGPVRGGHRQMTVYSNSFVTLVVFDFDAGARLADHQADAQVTILALGGLLEVTTPTQTYRLPEGSLLILDPGVKHAVFAPGKSQMLLTVARTATRDPDS